MIAVSPGSRESRVLQLVANQVIESHFVLQDAGWHDSDLPFQAGNLLLILRNELDLTQQQLADRAGVKRSYIARIESGHANPTMKSLARILASVGRRLVLGVDEAATSRSESPSPAERSPAQRETAVRRPATTAAG